ncbi:hypothetical protein, partial [uncultured Gammaproteobacteria bacterium]
VNWSFGLSDRIFCSWFFRCCDWWRWLNTCASIYSYWNVL